MKSTKKLQVFNGRYIQLNCLGKGAFGAAYLVQDIKDDAIEKVMKEIKLYNESGSTMSPQEIIKVTEEAITLCRLQHKHIIQYYDSFSSNDAYFIVTEFCEGGNLKERLDLYKKENKILDNIEIVEWTIQLVSALEYLHNDNFVHRDIKSLNIFIKNRELKFGDFGLAVQLPKTDQAKKGLAGTILYMSPELFAAELFSVKSDCWAFGVLLYEICCYDFPFQGNSIEEVVKTILLSEPPELPERYHSYLRLIIKGLLIKNPNLRLTITQVREIFTSNMDEAGQARMMTTFLQTNLSIAKKQTKPQRSEQTQKTYQAIHKHTETVSSICQIL